jgi:PAS domain S-box-containing protein
LLRTLVDTLPDHVYVKDTESRYVLNNFAHARALGAASPEEAARKSDFDFYPEELAERHRADEQEIIQSGRPLVNREQPSVDREGNRRWYSTTKVPLRDGNSEIVGLLGDMIKSCGSKISPETWCTFPSSNRMEVPT